MHMALLSFLLALLGSFTQSNALPNERSNKKTFGEIVSRSTFGFDWSNIEYVYAFGDSYTFVQGTRGLANFSFIGDLQNLGFTKEELLNDEIVFRNTSSDGANWIEFLTGCFSGRPSECSPRQLWDFAFAGADIDGNLLPLHHPFTVPLVDQVKQWVAYGAEFLPRPKKHTLIVWWIGINDTGDSTGNETITDFPAFFAQEMDFLFSAVELAHSKGLTGTHLFLTIPPEERSPSGLSSPPSLSTLHKSNIIEYNSQLLSRTRKFARNHFGDDTSVFVFDAHEWFGYVLDHSEMFGFTNITAYCECSDPEFFWYNSGHPTEHVHKLLGNAVNNFLSTLTSQPGK